MGKKQPANDRPIFGKLVKNKLSPLAKFAVCRPKIRRVPDLFTATNLQKRIRYEMH